MTHNEWMEATIARGANKEEMQLICREINRKRKA